jgi:uncharacterized protein (DUF58 family)
MRRRPAAGKGGVEGSTEWVRPGPGPVRSALVRTIELRVRRRIDALVPGDFRSLMLGDGVELAQIRPYELGDDVRRIDWSVTARTGEPHVRLHVAERALTTWVLVDVSPSMAFGTQDRTKADVSEGALLAISRLATAGANRLGAITFGRGATLALPPTGDRRQMLPLIESIEADRSTAGGGATAFSEAFELADRVCRRPGAVVVISDFRGPVQWSGPLSRLAQRHHVLALEVLDEREQRLVDAGEIVLVDPETGADVVVDTSDADLRRRFADAADADRADVRRALRASGAEHVVLTTSGDWLRALAGFLNKRRRTR